MIAEQRLISQIKDFVNGLDQEPSTNEHDLADQFAELCRTFTARVSKCEDLLEKGLRSEAVQEALSPPSLFQLRELMEIKELQKWRNICLDFGMTPPPELDFSTIDRLREECSTEQLLQPLLRKFRRLVHEGTRDERIQVLRQLRTHDPENPVWVENLEPLERQQLREIGQRAEEAIANNDINTLRDIYEDLTDPRRLLTAPEEIIGKVEERLKKQREAEALAEGEELAGKIKKSLADKDFDQLNELIEKWHRLERFADFHPIGDMKKIAADAKKWHNDEARRRETERAFQAAIDKLRSVLDQPRVDRTTLQQAWDHAGSFSKKIAEPLANSVPARIQELREEEEKRRRQKTLIVTTASVVAVIVLAVSGWFGWNILQMKRHEERLQAMWDGRRSTEMDNYLSQLREDNPDAFEQPKIQRYRLMLEDYKDKEADRLADLNSAMDQLQDIKADAYDFTSERIRTLLRQAETHAATDEEYRRIKNWQQDWELWRQRRQAEADRVFAEIKNDLQQTVTEIEAELQRAPIENLENKVARAESLAGRGADIEGRASTDVKQGWGALTSRLTSLKTQVEQRTRQIRMAREEQRNFFASLEDRLRSLTQYENALTDFLDKYPEAPEADELRTAVRQIPACRDALALNNIPLPAMPVTADQAEPFVNARDGLAAGQSSIWYNDLTTCIEYPQKAAAVHRNISRLRASRFWDWKKLRYREKGEEDWTTLYYPDTFFSRQETAPDGTQYTRYWGDAFQARAEAYTPRIERINFDSREYDVEWDERPEHNLIPAARYGRRLLESIPREVHIEDFLLDQIIELLNHENMHPVTAAELIKRIADYAAEAIPFNNTGIEELRNAFRGMNLETPWINHEHPRVRDEVDRISDSLRALSEDQVQAIKDKVQFNRWLVVQNLNRDIRIAGVVKKNPDSGGLYPEVTALDAELLYCVLPGREGVPNRFYVLARRGNDGEYQIPPNAENRAFVGQILLAPADAKGTTDFLDDAPVDTAVTNPDWPASWPVNARER